MTDRGEIVLRPSGPVVGVVRVPASKSLSNRALALAALASGTTRIDNPLVSGDTARMIGALRALGTSIEATGPDRERLERAIVQAATGSGPAAFPTADDPDSTEGDSPDRTLSVGGGNGAFGPAGAPLDLGGAGTAMRFLTALATVAQGEVILDGDARMRQRPIGPLIEGLRALGVEARSLERAGCPPVSVRGGTLRGGEARIAGGLSSQFVSALLMIAPLAPDGSSIVVTPPVVSFPYIDLTLDLMRWFGVSPSATSAPGTRYSQQPAASAPLADATRRETLGTGREILTNRTDGSKGTVSPDLAVDSGGDAQARNGQNRPSSDAWSGTTPAARSPGGEGPPPPSSAFTRTQGHPVAAAGPVCFEFRRAGRYRAPDHYRVPPDASSASYFFAAAAVSGGRVTIPGLFRGDLQGDVALLEYLEAMGCGVEADEIGTTVSGPAGGHLAPFDLDLVATPDLVPTLAVLALFADGASEIRNVANLRVKESDRLAALAAELARLGAGVEERQDGLRIVPRRGTYSGCRIETYNDHRIAMAFAVAGLVVPGVRIADPGCVAKSFPGFWRTFAGLTSC